MQTSARTAGVHRVRLGTAVGKLQLDFNVELPERQADVHLAPIHEPDARLLLGELLLVDALMALHEHLHVHAR